MRLGLYIPLFDELADPALVARLCAEAEEAGWDGVFVWDHVRWREPVVDVADTQITLAAIASATERIRLGPMVTRLARRRPAKVARETATLDRLSDGRLTLGVGLGSDRSRLRLVSPSALASWRRSSRSSHGFDTRIACSAPALLRPSPCSLRHLEAAQITRPIESGISSTGLSARPSR